MSVFHRQTVGNNTIRHILLALILLCNMPARSQDPYIKKLEKDVYQLNNEFKYDESTAAIRNFISTAKSNDDRYYGYLFLSYTYRRLFDDSVGLRYLDTALAYGLKTDKSDYYLNNINCQRSFTYFNLLDFKAADSVMKILAANNYKDLSNANQAIIFVQEGHILLRKKNY